MNEINIINLDWNCEQDLLIGSKMSLENFPIITPGKSMGNFASFVISVLK